MTVLSIIHRALLASVLGFAVTACSQAGGETNPSGPAETAEPLSNPADEAKTYDLTARFIENGVAYGAEDAPVTLVEYASLTCGACKQFHEAVMPTIKENYIKTGKVQFILREYPTQPAQIALAGFVTARCSGEANHMAVIDDFFFNQDGIFKAASEGKAEPALKELAARHGVDGKAFDTCLADLDIRRDIAAAIEAGEVDGVNQTPTLFLNGEKLGSKARTAGGLSELIDSAIAVIEVTTSPEGEQ